MVLSFIPATDVGVGGRGFDGFGGRARAVEPRLEDGAHGGVADRVDGERPLAGCFQPIALITPRQGDDAHGGTITLLGMRALTHQPLDQRGGVDANPDRHLDQARRRHIGVTLMGLGHVLVHGDMTAALGAAHMAGDTRVILISTAR